MLRESLEAEGAEAGWRPVLASAMTLQPPAAAFAAVPDTGSTRAISTSSWDQRSAEESFLSEC
jgi:hypothetical protein